MNQILLNPTDVLFFRDGRPMAASSAGHGSAWPMPHVLSAALHAALHRADLPEHYGIPVHSHRRRIDREPTPERDRLFGCLQSCGPFPVRVREDEAVHEWVFPRPADADDRGEVFLHPLCGASSSNGATAPSSLNSPCAYPVASNRAPSKRPPRPWWNVRAWEAHLSGRVFGDGTEAYADDQISDTEHNYGIEISPDAGTVVSGQFYSAHYLRLKPEWRLGMLAAANDREFNHPDHGSDLVAALLNGNGSRIILGGQQRVCSATSGRPAGGRLPLPVGARPEGRLVKWVLLSPAIWPGIAAGQGSGDGPIHSHPGGWLPNWVAAEDHELGGESVSAGSVLLHDGPGKSKARRLKVEPGKRIRAKLVAAVVPKALPVTGYALPHEEAGRSTGGAKSTHLAVPAGSVYYFECADPDEAAKLADALNWHGTTDGAEVRNRRSTLLGEKGFGIGVCGTWKPHSSP